MKIRAFLIIMVLFVLCSAAFCETRTYRQFVDVAAKENGQVQKSGDKDDLFEFTYNIDEKNGIVTRTKIRRLDQEAAKDDNTIYAITQTKDLRGSEAGRGGNVIVAVQKNGGEILVIGKRFAFTSRTSPFSQIITGVYNRVFVGDRDKKLHKRPAE